MQIYGVSNVVSLIVVRSNADVSGSRRDCFGRIAQVYPTDVCTVLVRVYD